MDELFMQEILQQASFGYASHKILCNEKGEGIDYIFLDVNNAFEEMTGLKKENVIGKRVTEILPSIRKGNFDWVDFYCTASLKGEKTEITQYSEPLNRWYEVTTHIPKEGYFVAIFQEISEKVKTLELQKQQINKLAQELKTVFNSTQDAMFLVKVEDGNFKYMRNNQAHQKITGLSLNEIKDKTPAELVGIEAGKSLEDNYRKCLNKKETITYEEILNLPGRKRIWLTSLNPVIEGGKVKYIVGSSKDITQQKQAEEDIRNRLKHEKIISRISQLALTETNINTIIGQSLRTIGEELEVSRAYIFESDSKKGIMNNTFEWTSTNIRSQIEYLQDIPENEFDWWLSRLKNNGVINYKDIEDISDQNTKEILKVQNIKSILVLPIYYNRVYYGFIGFDDCNQYRQWTELDIKLLKVTTQVITRVMRLYEKEEMLWSENQKFKAIINSTEDLIVTFDRKQKFTAMYGNLQERLELKQDCLLGKTLSELFVDERASIHEEANKKALSGKTARYEWRLEENGQKIYFQNVLSPMRNREGKVSGVVGVCRDITKLIKSQKELQKERELLQTTLLSIGDGVVTTDTQGIITSMNKIAEEITGWKEEQAKGKNFSKVFKLYSEKTGEKVEDPVEKVLTTGQIIGLANHTFLVTKDERQVPIADSAAPIKDEKNRIFGVVMVFRDVINEKIQQEKILYLSYHDPLTGLYNRRYVEEKLKHLEKSKELPFAVMMGDLNGLKLVNDVFGHEEGDMLLKKAAEVISESCRKQDVVARWGGDEFIILMPGTNAKTAEKLIKRIKNRCIYEECKTKVSIALGYAIKGNSSDTLKDVIKESEEWMYRNKLLEGKSFRNAIINTMISTLFAKSMETEAHADRLQSQCIEIAKEIKLSSKDINELSLLALLHDMGKVAINENILKKPGPLTPEEWEEMRKHPEIGYRIARNTPELASVAEYILFHHERWDGKGYPKGLKGKEIPLICRILSVVDAYDAMTNDRCYRKAMDKEGAIEELKRNAGTQFDPQIVNVFCEKIDTSM